MSSILPWSRRNLLTEVEALIEAGGVPPHIVCESVTCDDLIVNNALFVSDGSGDPPLIVKDDSGDTVFHVATDGSIYATGGIIQSDTDAQINESGVFSGVDVSLPGFASVKTSLTSQASAISTNTTNIATNTSAIATLQTKTQHIADNGTTTTLSGTNTIISGNLQVTGTTTTINTTTTQANNMILTYTGVGSTPALAITQTGGSGAILSITDADTNEIFQINQNCDLAVNTNKFTVANSSGNTAIAGTLTVTGTTTLTGGLNTPLTVSNGGTGVSSTTAYAVLCGGTTSTAALQSIASVGSSGQVLTSNGAGALPTFQSVSAGFTTSFRAYLNSTVSNVTGDGTVYIPVMNSVSGTGTGWNIGGGYNTSTGIFTCPAGQSGYYQFVGEFIVLGLTSSHTGLYVTPGGTYSYGNNNMSLNPWNCCIAAGASITVNPVSTLVYLAAGETFRFALQVQGGSKVVGLSSSSVMSGWRVQ